MTFAGMAGNRKKVGNDGRPHTSTTHPTSRYRLCRGVELDREEGLMSQLFTCGECKHYPQERNWFQCKEIDSFIATFDWREKGSPACKNFEKKGRESQSNENKADTAGGL